MTGRLVGDIGGTWSRLAWQEDCSAPVRRARFANRDFGTLDDLLDTALEVLEVPPAAVRGVVLALPAPVPPGAETVHLTNIDWTVRREALARRFGQARIRLLNDFQAAALGVLDSDLRATLQNGRPATDRVAVVTGPGTGLGLAWVADARTTSLPHATEGGHSGFAPQGELQRELGQWLGERFDHVSWERVVSGPGLEWIHAFLQDWPQPRESAAGIIRRAREGDPGAGESVSLFLACYAHWIGDLALVFRPGGGIHLTGGMTAHLAHWMDAEFTRIINDKGRMGSVVEGIAVHRSLVEEPGLEGALLLACRMEEEEA